MSRRALGWLLLVLAIAALLTLSLRIGPDFPPQNPQYPQNPAVYAQCVGNDHHSDICLGA